MPDFEGDEPLPPRCGYPFDGGFHGGMGCGKPFERHADVFRCADCGVPMHRRCLVEHFADGKEHEIEGHGRVRSPHPMPHPFALQVAYAVQEVLKRDAEIARLKDNMTALILRKPDGVD